MTTSDHSIKESDKQIKLDAIDRRILRHLRDNGRMTNVNLARLSGISAPPCLRRVRALEIKTMVLFWFLIDWCLFFTVQRVSFF